MTAISPNRALFVFDAQSDNGDLSGGSWRASLPLSNLQDPRLERIARSMGVSLSVTQFRVSLRAPVSVGAIYLGWTNCTSLAKFRIRYWPNETFTGSPDLDTGFISGLIPDDTDEDRGPSLYYVPDDDRMVQFFTIEIDDTTNPAGHIDIGRLIIGQYCQPSINYAFQGNSFSQTQNAIIANTLAGDEEVWDRAEPRALRVSFDVLDESELYGPILTMLRKAKRGGEVVVIPYPGASSIERQRRSFLGRIVARDSIAQTAYQRGSVGFELREKLGLAPTQMIVVFRLATATGVLTLTGNDLLIGAASRTLVVARASFTLTGEAAGLFYRRYLAATGGVLSLAGQGLGFARSLKLAIGQGSVAFSGEPIGLNRTHDLMVDFGGYLLAGSDVQLVVRRLPMTQGVFALTGEALSLLRGLILATAGASFSATGGSLVFVTGNQLQVAGGLFALTGEPAAMKRGLKMAIANGAIALTGQTLRFSYGAALTNGSVTLTGEPLALKAAKIAALAGGSLALTGEPVILTRQAKITMTGASIVMTGEAAVLRNYDYRVLAGDEIGNRRVLAGDEAGNVRRTV